MASKPHVPAHASWVKNWGKIENEPVQSCNQMHEGTQVMLMQTVIYVLTTIVELFVLAVLLRFYAQVFRASFRNPIAQFAVALTDWIVKPLRRLVPSIMGLDSASFLTAWIAQMILWGVVLALRNEAAYDNPVFWPVLAALALVMVLKLSIYLLIGVVIVQAVLSWVNPYHPIRPFFDSLCRVFLRPLQRIIPLVGGVDLSPLVLLIVLQVLLMLPIALLQHQVLAMLQQLPR